MANNLNRMKQNAIQALKKAFNNNVKKIRNYYLGLISQVIRSKNKPNIGRIDIDFYCGACNNNIKETDRCLE